MPEPPDDIENPTPVSNAPEPETAPAGPSLTCGLKTVGRAVLKARRTPRPLGPVWLLLTAAAGTYLTGAGVWALLQLHGVVRIATTAGVSMLVLVGAWLRRRGWLG